MVSYVMLAATTPSLSERTLQACRKQKSKIGKVQCTHDGFVQWLPLQSRSDPMQ